MVCKRDYSINIPTSAGNGSVAFKVRPLTSELFKSFASLNYTRNQIKHDDMIGFISEEGPLVSLDIPSVTR